ncbi:MAG: ABC transporter permease [Leptothrix sp. (in: b-proteobacteria)]
MMPKMVWLWTDLVLYAVALAVLVYVWHVWRSPLLRASWRRVFRDAAALCSLIILVFFALIAALDSVHFRRALPASAGSTAAGQVFYATSTESVLDLVLAHQLASRERSYSRPLAWRSFTKESLERDGQPVRDFPRLQYGGAHLSDPAAQWLGDILPRTGLGLLSGALVGALAWWAVALIWVRRSLINLNTNGKGVAENALENITAAVAGDLKNEADRKKTVSEGLWALWHNNTELPLRAALLTFTLLAMLLGVAVLLGQGYHVLGTDRTGNDVLYQALKSVRTAFVIGTLSTIATLPLAVTLGILAGYFRGWVDELIQYVYTTLSSVPGVLLIAACVLMVQVFLDKHPELFETGLERADLKIFLLCLILGVTGWAGLCRLLRGETMKLRELDYVQAATAFGVGHLRIMVRHIFPNLVHLVLITTVLEFSGLVLFEAVLSFVGVGVDPVMNSFGGMINLARSEMSRDPLVWWSFAAAFVFMVALVLAANLFADGVRDAFDPRARVFRKRLMPRRPVKSGPAAATGAAR